MRFFNNKLQIFFWKLERGDFKGIQINKFENGYAEAYMRIWRIAIFLYWKHSSKDRYHKTIKF